MLITLAVRPPRGTPQDAQALARHELTVLDAATRATLPRLNLDLQARAHLEALQSDVDRALKARATLPA